MPKSICKHALRAKRSLPCGRLAFVLSHLLSIVLCAIGRSEIARGGAVDEDVVQDDDQRKRLADFGDHHLAGDNLRWVGQK